MSPLHPLIREIRTFYNTLLERGEALHAAEGITLGMRAVLELLQLHGSHTVPAMARDRHVTRQRIQALVNELRDRGLVEPQPNPRSQRSHLIALTPDGIATIERMLQREQNLFRAAVIPVDAAELRHIAARLGEIRRALEEAAGK